jgi:dolichyl-phosphate-mannose--protein O-mannosyl transferase
VTATLEAAAAPNGPDEPALDDARTDLNEVDEQAPPPNRVPAALAPWHDPHPLVGWGLTALIFAVAAVTRFWALSFPSSKEFDEVYYATEAQEIARFGYEDNRGYLFIVHPPLGKWAIALTSWMFGNNSLGWRVAPAIAGIASVYILTRTARRMFHSNLFGAIAGLLLALDGVSIVQSRVALLDIFLQTFVIAGFGALVADRDQMRARLAGLVEAGVDLSTGVPTLGPRPWRVVAGFMLGLACAVKWSALSFYVVFAIMSMVWDRGALKSAGVRYSWRNAARRSWIYALGSYLIVPVTSYLLSNLGWFAGENSYNRHWADGRRSYARLDLLGLHVPFNWGFLPNGIRSLGDDIYRAYQFHESLDSFHPYKSNPWSWLILGRPITYYYPSNVQGCGSPNCSREVLLIGTPLMWWAFVPALIWLTWHWFTTRDWRASMVWLAMAAGWLVWFQDPKRTMFLFYMTPLVPFLILGVTLALGVMLGPAVGTVTRAGGTVVRVITEQRRRIGIICVAAYIGLVIVDFAWMWPIFTGGKLTYDQWHAHMWFASWV